MAAAVLAVAGIVLPDPVGRTCAVAAFAVVAFVPVIRIGWLGIRWWKRGDRRYASLPPAIVVVIAIGVLLALA
ncbi:MAG: hypothetical protein FJW94_04500 [Actinobacteria bacterium]|nr:hypothetical protein [Actinomycetota bacterium]